MKKHILLGLIAAAFCMDSAKVEGMDWYGKVGVGVQQTTDEATGLGKDDHTRFCGYAGLGASVGFSDAWFGRIEFGSSFATNAKKIYDFEGEKVKVKGNNIIPRLTASVGMKLGEDASVSIGGGAAYLSSKATCGDETVRNSGLTPVAFMEGEKCWGSKWAAFTKGSYFFNKDKKVNDEKLKRRGFEIIVGAAYHISM